MTTNNDHYAPVEASQTQPDIATAPPPDMPPHDTPSPDMPSPELAHATPVEREVPIEREIPSDGVLFDDSKLTGMRAHWDEVQATFVDDPRHCVRQADALVADVVENLTTSFGATRSRLEAQWAEGQDVSTEDLRVALTQYREFFHRLLAV